MKNHEQLPAIDENILDGVAGGAGFASENLKPISAALKGGADGVKAAVQLPRDLAGAALNFAGDIAGAWEDYFRGLSGKVKGE